MIFTASAVGVSAILEPTGEYTPDASVETNRYYFYMPQEWYNEYTNTAGVYWWEGTDACGDVIDGSGYSLRWPGYKLNESNEDDIFYIDCPKDVPIIVWNNYLDGGTDTTLPIYTLACQARDAAVEFYSDGDSDMYPTEFFEYVEESFYGDKAALGEYADNFFMDTEYDAGMSFTMDNMIYVVDPKLTEVIYDGKLIYSGEWYFYYGNGEYGNYPLKADAEHYGEIGILESYDATLKPTDSVISTIPQENTVYVPGSTYETIAPTAPTTPYEFYPVEGDNNVYFDVKASGWGNVRIVFCHIWRTDGLGEVHPWQSKKEKCTYDTTTGIASYDLSKLNFEISPDDGREYCVIFSANTGMQTYTSIMSGGCIGDMMYCSNIWIENPEDREKKSAVAFWFNNPDCGPQRRITSIGNIVGTAHADGESDVTMLADYLIQYYNEPCKTDLTQDIINKLNVSPDDVMEAVIDRVEADDLDDNISIESTEPSTGVAVENNTNYKISYIKRILDMCTDPTKGGGESENIIECDLNGDGYTNIIDATLIQKYAAELIAFTSSQCKIADINSDGVVSVVDTTLIQKRLAGIS